MAVYLATGSNIATGSYTETEKLGILVYQIEGRPRGDRPTDNSTRQTKAEQSWAEKLARQRSRALRLWALRERRRLYRMYQRRFHTYPRRLLDSSPRDVRSLPHL